MSDERAKFEAWLKEKWPGHPIVSMNFPDGSFEYKSAGAQHKWEGWKAGRALQVVAPADESAQDARRYRWLRDAGCTFYVGDERHHVCEWAMDSAIDAAMAKGD